MKNYIPLLLPLILLGYGCSKDSSPALSGRIDSYCPSCKVLDNSNQYVPALIFYNSGKDTILIGNLPKSYKEGQNIKFRIRPTRMTDPGVICATFPILPQPQYVDLVD
ncbi:hypothetical protein SAMN05216311_114129 [Chitinophaga sp. CF418]|nr:hypothetical protein SAMN05216311_114129 [Chitinophaga sp. CF418]